MDILYDHQIFSTQKYGGISRYFYELITRLSGQPENKVSVFLGFNINEYGLEKHHRQYNRFFGFRRPVIPRTGKLFLLLNDILISGFAKKSNYTIYHQTYYYKSPQPLGGKKVITVHDMIHELFPQDFPSDDQTSRLKKWSCEHADGIICVSESTKRDLQNIFGIPEDKIKVVYHGNSLTMDVISPPVVDCPYILYVGNRAGYKNFSLLLSAFAGIPRINANFKLVCFGGGHFNTNECQDIDDLGLVGKIRYFSGPDEMLANLYNYASAFIFPSLYEGFGIPPLEAMYYGCPLLVSRSSSIPEVVAEAGLYFDPVSQEDLRLKLDKILSDHSLGKDLIRLGYEQVKKFSWDACAGETLDFYRHISGF